MQASERVKKILDAYESDSPGTKANLARILMQGKLGGTGKLVILPWIRASSTARRAASRPTRRPTTRTTISSSRSMPAYPPMPRPWA